jgi:hypothetical protein
MEVEEEDIIGEVQRKMKDINRQAWSERLRRSRYAGELRNIIAKEKGLYEKETMTRSKDALEIVARFRLESETRDSKFWKREEERKCRHVERN